MKKLLFCLLLFAAPLQAPAQARELNQAELDALLAPVALYPDALLNQILEASKLPDQVRHAAYWSRSNPQLSGDEAVNAAQSQGWHPSVSSLTAFPDVLQRLDENPQWLRDLGEAYSAYEPYVMETVQQLRRRAEASGNLRSDGQQAVSRQGDTIVVQPAYPQIVVVPYYNPMIVFGTWWWASYRPVVWRPFVPRPVICHWNPRPIHQPIHRPNDRPTHVQNWPHRNPPVPHAKGPRWPNGTPSPAARIQVAQAAARPQSQAIARPQMHAVVHAPVMHAASRATARASNAPFRGR